MRLGEHEGVVVYDPSNMFYLSGYTGEGLVLVARGISAIITDFRYTAQAQAQAPGFEVLMTEKGKSHEDIAGALCASGGIDTLYYEDDFVTVHTFNALRESVRGVEWKVVGSEIARLREIKDEDELALIRQACRITGEAFERILPHIKEGVTEKELALRIAAACGAWRIPPASRGHDYHGFWRALRQLLRRHDPNRGLGPALG